MEVYGANQATAVPLYCTKISKQEPGVCGCVGVWCGVKGGVGFATSGCRAIYGHRPTMAHSSPQSTTLTGFFVLPSAAPTA